VYQSGRKVWIVFGAKFRGIKASVANSCHTYIFWSRSGTVGWGTALQFRRSRVRFWMRSILPVPVWPWGRLSL